jgi:predicted transposase YdaD
MENLIDQRIDPKFLPHFSYFKIAEKRKEEEWKRMYLDESKLEGSRETALANARKLKKLGVDIKIIVAATGLDRKDVERL